MRNLIWVALALAVGIGVVVFLGSDGGDEGYGPTSDAGDPEAAEPGAALEGTGTALEAEVEVERPTGSAALSGIVVDPANEPVAGVTLALRTPKRPAWERWRVTRQLEQAFETPAYAEPPFASTTSAADGTFRFADLDPRRMYALEALPAEGRCGTMRYIGRSNLSRRVTIVVRPGVPLKVRTVDAHGAALAAWVDAYLPDDGREGSPPAEGRSWHLQPVRSDASGVLDLVAVPRGKPVFSLFIPGIGRRGGIPVDVPHDGVAVLALGDPDGAIVRGAVSDSSGAAVAGARVLVMAYPGEGKSYSMRISRAATTASDGTYRVGGLPAGSLRSVMVDAPGYLFVANASSEKAIPARGEVVVDATLYRGGVIQGTVRDADGAPIAGAVVMTGTAGRRFSNNAANVGRGTTDAEGRFKLENVALGAGRLAAWAPGHYTPPDDTGRSHWWISRAGAPFELKEEGERLSLDLTLEASMPVTGQVVDAEGRSVAGVHVEARGGLAQAVAWFDPHALSATSDEEGRFGFVGLPPGPWTLHATTTQGISEPVPVAVSTTAAPRPAEIVLRPGGSIRGRVEVGGRPPAEPVRVVLQLKGARGRSTQNTTTQDGGRFEFEGVAAGDYDVYMTAMFGETAGEKEAVSVAWGAVAEDVVVRGAEVGSIRGIVVDAAGEPMPGVSVSLEYSHGNMSGSWGAGAGPDGRFRFENLPKGKYTISIAGGKQKHVAEPGPDELRIVHDASEAFVIEGTVLAPDGKPVASGQILVLFVKGGGSSGRGVIVSKGAFRFEGARQEGKINIQVVDANDELGRPIEARPFQLEDYKPDGQPVELRLEAGLSIAGRVVDAVGNPVAGVHVRVRPPRRRGVHQHMGSAEPVVSDEQGRFEAVGLGDGKHTVSILGGGDWIPTTQRLEVEAGRSNVELKVERGVRISGHVRGPDGEALMGCRVRFRPDRKRGGGSRRSMRSTQTQTDADGAFELRGVVAGATGRLTAGPPPSGAKGYMEAIVEEVAAGSSDHVITLEVGVYIEGTVTGPAGESVPGVSVSAVDPKRKEFRPYSSSWMDAGSKSFRLGPVPPGMYRVTANASGEYKNSDPVEVRAPAKGVKLVVPKGNPLKGRVLGEDVERFTVRYAYKHGSTTLTTSASVNADGTFLISLANDVSGQVFVSKPGDPRFALIEDVRPSAGELAVTLQPGKSISGRVENLDPEHPTHYSDGRVAQMRLQHASGFHFYASVLKDGSFEAMGCPDGAYHLLVRQGRRRAEQKDVEAGTTGLVLRLEEK